MKFSCSEEELDNKICMHIVNYFIDSNGVKMIQADTENRLRRISRNAFEECIQGDRENICKLSDRVSALEPKPKKPKKCKACKQEIVE